MAVEKTGGQKLRRLEGPLKRTITLPDLLPDIDAERLVFPNGVVSKLKAQQGGELTRRIEILGEEESEIYGVSHDMFVTYTAGDEIWDVARRSNFVVEIRGLRDKPHRRSSERYFKDTLVVKKLVTKASSHENSLIVPKAWMDKVSASEGQRAILSNTVTDFVLPPPTISK
jgi:hypothetical protein